MSRPTDKDLDSLLRKALDQSATAPGDHPSPGILAAWRERGLDASERGRWEEHFARCGRCQEDLAALARIEAAEPHGLPWWRRLILPSFPAVRWAAAGAAAVLALSVAIRFAPEAGPDMLAAKAPVERTAKQGPFQNPAAAEDTDDEEAAAGPDGAVAATTPERTIVVASPERSNLWRLADGGRIDRSSDGGATWTRLETGVEADLLAGMAPLERVCWVVGRDGTILRTTEGTSWQQIPSPTDADLVHVWAVDAYHATVATASGREYRTEDGGQNWRESPKAPDA